MKKQSWKESFNSYQKCTKKVKMKVSISKVKITK